MKPRSLRRLSLVTLAALVGNLAPAAPTAHADPAPPPPIWGFADLHAHMFSNLGFGGLAVWGKPFVPDNDIAKALPWSDFAPYVEVGPVVRPNGEEPPTIHVGVFPWLHVPATCPPGTGTFENPCVGVSVHGIGGFGDLLNPAFGGTFGHGVAGYPEFDGWPRWNNYTGQQMYHEWLKRAHDGGLRLMVMLAVNNEELCKAINRKEAFGCDDMPAIERQLQAAHDLEAFVDDLDGGPGEGWFRIARSSGDARAAIAAGKLAVVLGIETPSLFGCKSQAGCTPEFVLSELDRFHGLGVRHILPVHNADSGFAGTAFFHDLLAIVQRGINGEWWDVRSCPADSGVDLHLQLLDTINDFADWPILGPLFAAQYPDRPPRPPAGPNCNDRGLTTLGATLVNGMIDRGMLVDVDHMSLRAFDDTLDLAGQRRYPGVISSHTGVRSSLAATRVQVEGERFSTGPDGLYRFAHEMADVAAIDSPSIDPPGVKADGFVSGHVLCDPAAPPGAAGPKVLFANFSVRLDTTASFIGSLGADGPVAPQNTAVLQDAGVLSFRGEST